MTVIAAGGWHGSGTVKRSLAVSGPKARARHADQADGPRSATNAPLLIAVLLLPVMGVGLYRLAVTDPVPIPVTTPEAGPAVAC